MLRPLEPPVQHTKVCVLRARARGVEGGNGHAAAVEGTGGGDTDLSSSLSELRQWRGQVEGTLTFPAALASRGGGGDKTPNVATTPLFIALHMMSDRMAPDEPMSAPTMVSRLCPDHERQISVREPPIGRHHNNRHNNRHDNRQQAVARSKPRSEPCIGQGPQ